MQNFNKWYDETREKAIRDDARFNQLVSVKSEDTSLGYPLSALADAAHVNIFAQVFDETHSVSLGPVPLKDALDQIAAKFHSAWGVSQDGTILFHHREGKGSQGQKAATK